MKANTEINCFEKYKKPRDKRTILFTLYLFFVISKNKTPKK